jgi:hypothetical protein
MIITLNMHELFANGVKLQSINQSGMHVSRVRYGPCILFMGTKEKSCGYIMQCIIMVFFLLKRKGVMFV